MSNFSNSSSLNLKFLSLGTSKKMGAKAKKSLPENILNRATISDNLVTNSEEISD